MEVPGGHQEGHKLLEIFLKNLQSSRSFQHLLEPVVLAKLSAHSGALPSCPFTCPTSGGASGPSRRSQTSKNLLDLLEPGVLAKLPKRSRALSSCPGGYQGGRKLLETCWTF